MLGKNVEVELVLKANHVQVHKGQYFPRLITPEVENRFKTFWEFYTNDPLVGRDIILKSFCPQVSRHFHEHLTNLGMLFFFLNLNEHKHYQTLVPFGKCWLFCSHISVTLVIKRHPQ